MNNQEANAKCAKLCEVTLSEDHNGYHIFPTKERWNPCENHNQIIEYLWPRLNEEGVYCLAQFIENGVFSVFIQKPAVVFERHPEIDEDEWEDPVDLSDQSTDDPKQIARTCVDAFIQAMEGLKDDN